MARVKVFVPYGAVGLGCSEEAFKRGLAMNPDILCSDAGSTDSGPYYLGTGKGKYARLAVRKDLKQMIEGAHALGVPMVIGSVGTCGSDLGVDETTEIIREICEELRIHKKIVKIYSQQDSEIIKKKFKDGKVTALLSAPEISEKTFDECSNIVALCGAEPYQKALEVGAEIVIGGRSTDTAVIAAYPLMKGCHPAFSWHAAKVMECGGLCTSGGLSSGVFAEFDETGFTIHSVADGATVSPYSVSAHLLYENSDPYHLTEPGIRIDTTKSTYTAINETSVRVEGTMIEYLPYTMKLEGAGPVGYQTISIVGIRDRDIMKNPMTWIDDVAKQCMEKLNQMGIKKENYRYNLKPYGYNAVSGMPVPKEYVPNEIGVLLTVTADTQALATQVAKAFNPLLLHHNIFPDRQMPSFGFVFSPSEIERGAVYEFKLYHTVSIDNPFELVRMETEII